MTMRRIWEIAAWTLTLIMLALVAWSSATRGKPDMIERAATGRAWKGSPLPTVVMFDDDTLDHATARTSERDPFRLDRRPAAVAFSTIPMGVPGGMPIVSAPAVHIVLQGTIGGPPWQAILSGIPGHDGTVVVQAGDTLGGIAIRKITHDSAIIRMKDSTWAETLAKR